MKKNTNKSHNRKSYQKHDKKPTVITKTLTDKLESELINKLQALKVNNFNAFNDCLIELSSRVVSKSETLNKHLKLNHYPVYFRLTPKLKLLINTWTKHPTLVGK